MSNDTKMIHDVATGEINIIELTDEEQAARNAEIAAFEAAKAQAKQEADELRQNKISAYEKLGLTPAEIEALLPSNIENEA
jgi:hypothetical protein